MIHVWWYDRQGAIQTTGFQLLKHMEYFLLLLLALDRLPRAPFPGIRREDQGEGRPQKVYYESKNGPTFELGKELSPHFGIVGRGTKVYEAKYVEPKAPPTNRGKGKKSQSASASSSTPSDAGMTPSLADMELVAKAAHLQEGRIPEDEMVAGALHLATTYEGKDKEEIQHAIFGHVPEIVDSADYCEVNTKDIRVAVGIGKTGPEHNRILRVIVARKLQPIKDVPVKHFWKVFWDCVRCE